MVVCCGDGEKVTVMKMMMMMMMMMMIVCERSVSDGAGVDVETVTKQDEYNDGDKVDSGVMGDIRRCC